MVFIVTSYSFSDKFLLKSENLQHNKGWFAYFIVYTSRHNPFILASKADIKFCNFYSITSANTEPRLPTLQNCFSVVLVSRPRYRI